jgi:hypothetical protein
MFLSPLPLQIIITITRDPMPAQIAKSSLYKAEKNIDLSKKPTNGIT